MAAYGYPYQTMPSVPLGAPIPQAAPPPPLPSQAGAPYAAPVAYGIAGGAWYALLIVLFIVILVFGSIWWFGSQFYC
ncbi:hypothetical protein [Niallia nealsonii]|uniref:Uncharacterized protein n=1 Tax=Niallia nealsonii TaxID=115979 RepID=A0A2N0Z4P5_9BACI|nr:hypothetical protein [Niallia nealsonii]PKG24485.1 hypothetical protein CWS01_06690 [Niallia nealsonii]